MNKFVFVHIMKCGGTSFNRIMRRKWGENRVYNDKSFRRDRKLYGIISITNESDNFYPRQFDPQYHMCVVGHFTARKYKYLEWPQFTMLRDPVERIISYYSFWTSRLERNEAWSNKNRAKQGLPPKYFPRSKLKMSWFVKQMPNEMFHMCGGNLSRFKFAGICEWHEESMRVFQKLIRTKLPTTRFHCNRTPKHDKLDFNKRTRSLIEKYNQKDILLYNKALRRFEREARRYLK